MGGKRGGLVAKRVQKACENYLHLQSFFHDTKTGKQQAYMDAINKFCGYPLKNVKELKRTIADHLIEQNGYAL